METGSQTSAERLLSFDGKGNRCNVDPSFEKCNFSLGFEKSTGDLSAAAGGKTFDLDSMEDSILEDGSIGEGNESSLSSSSSRTAQLFMETNAFLGGEKVCGDSVLELSDFNGEKTRTHSRATSGLLASNVKTLTSATFRCTEN